MPNPTPTCICLRVEGAQELGPGGDVVAEADQLRTSKPGSPARHRSAARPGASTRTADRAVHLDPIPWLAKAVGAPAEHGADRPVPAASWPGRGRGCVSEGHEVGVD